ncbi:MAG TPA: asparagine synthase-related protein [Thermoanaerobaculia bacterium]|nr:asparagine synthase-related protein [Thermoanaerobaculia bacterium]
MGALFASIRLDGAPAGLEDLFRGTAEAGGDDSVRSWGWAALGCRAFRSTPQEIGESQPLVDLVGGRFALLFDGRLDNREELGLGAEESDAAAVLRFLSGGTWDALDRFVGPWALLLLDLREREVHLARDPTGERMLCWHADPARILVASEPAALPSRDFDEETLASFFAVREPAPDATFFRAVKQVPPGCRVTLSASKESRHSFWNPDLTLLRGSEADSVEAFRERLSTAVRAQLRAIGPAAVLMSGGLDSTTVAAHAAREGKIRAVSWRFRELKEADESAFAQAMMTAAGLEPVWVDGDGCWPLRDKGAADPSLPFENPYRELHAAAFSAAAEGGSRALLTGHFSDEMYHGVDAWWLRDSLARGGWAAAARGLRDELRWGSRPDVWTPGLRRALGVLLLGPAWERLRSLRDPSWLIPSAYRALQFRPVPQYRARHPEQAQTLLAPFAMMGIAVEMRRARHHGVELRFPFRDRRLIELALRLPADHLARPGWRKRLVWLAGEGWLPDEVRLRRRMSDLGPLSARGIGEREHETVKRLLFGEGPQLWRRWVDPAVLERFLDTARTGGSGLPTLVFWRCLAAELWARSLLE